MNGMLQIQRKESDKLTCKPPLIRNYIASFRVELLKGDQLWINLIRKQRKVVRTVTG